MSRFSRSWLALLWLAWPWLGTAVPAAQVIKNSDCLECHADKTLAKTNATGKVTVLFVDEAKFKTSRHGTNLCAGCHTDLKPTHPDDNVAAKPVSCAACHERQTESYGTSVHGLAVRAGKADAAGCKDCHGTHEITSPNSPASPLHYTRLASTCGECHPDVARRIQASVHGKALAAGRREAPTCTDCHSEHRIEGLKIGKSLKLAGEVCSRCHASERIVTRYKAINRVKSFFESYHGLAVQSGSARAANCASCHGVHDILPSTDPRSTIYRTNLVQTCGKCHPGANANFVEGKIHVDDNEADDLAGLINHWVRRIYIGLIVGTIGFMFLHNLLMWRKKVLAHYHAADRAIVRMDACQRIQHLLLLSSFFLLVWTGFALKYPDAWFARLLLSEDTVRRYTHRVAGAVMLAVGFYHLFYIAFSAKGRQLVRDLWPTLKDLTDLADTLAYLMGRTPKRPQIGRFGYGEKAEYWAVVWGTIIMGATGLMIWFKMDVTRFVPRWAVDVATTIHYYEAILATLAICVWHLYHVVFDPDVYPLSLAWFDGKVEEHWYRDEHPLDPALSKNPAAKPTPPTAKGASGKH